MLEDLEGVESGDVLLGDVGGVMLEAAVDEEVGVDGPAGVAEALNGREFVPLTGLGVVELESDLLVDGVGASAHHDHHRPHENGRVLVPLEGGLDRLFVRRLHPVPPAISVPAQTPGVVERGAVALAASENYHHPGSTSRRAEGGRVVDPGRRILGGCVDFDPLERAALHVQAPDIVHWLLAGVPAADQEMWLVEDQRVSVAAAWRQANNRHDHPLR